MPYSKQNLSDVKDSAAEHGLSETQEARFPGSDLDAEQTGIANLTVKAGKKEAFAHKHGEAEEVIVVLSGSGAIKLDDEVLDLVARDAVRIGPGTTRMLQGGDEDLEVLIVGPHVEKDAEMVEGFWDE